MKTLNKLIIIFIIGIFAFSVFSPIVFATEPEGETNTVDPGSTNTTISDPTITPPTSLFVKDYLTADQLAILKWSEVSSSSETDSALLLDILARLFNNSFNNFKWFNTYGYKSTASANNSSILLKMEHNKKANEIRINYKDSIFTCNVHKDNIPALINVACFLGCINAVNSNKFNNINDIHNIKPEDFDRTKTAFIEEINKFKEDLSKFSFSTNVLGYIFAYENSSKALPYYQLRRDGISLTKNGDFITFQADIRRTYPSLNGPSIPPVDSFDMLDLLDKYWSKSNEKVAYTAEHTKPPFSTTPKAGKDYTTINVLKYVIVLTAVSITSFAIYSKKMKK